MFWDPLLFSDAIVGLELDDYLLDEVEYEIDQDVNMATTWEAMNRCSTTKPTADEISAFLRDIELAAIEAAKSRVRDHVLHKRLQDKRAEEAKRIAVEALRHPWARWR